MFHLRDISKDKGTRFRFATDIKRGHVAEYMVMPKDNNSTWAISLINIHPESPFVGVISNFGNNDALMSDEVIKSN